MAKQNRGKGLKYIEGIVKGKCPMCGRTNTKLLWEITDENGEDIKVCKRCRKR